MATYDDYQWHVESGEFPEDLAPERAFNHIALYLAWLTAREMVSDDFTAAVPEVGEMIQALTGGEGGDFPALAAALLAASEGALNSEQLDAEGDQFTAEYYEEVYPGDWESTVFYEEAETPYHVEPTGEHLTELFERLDEQHASWSSGEWESDEVYEGTVRLWDLSDGEQLVGSPGEIACVSPDGLRMASADLDGAITVFEVTSGGILGRLTGHEAPITALVFDREGKRLASAGFDGSVRVWDAESGEEMITFEGGEEVVETIEFTPDGKRLLTTGHPIEAFLDDEDDDEIEAMMEAMSMVAGLESSSDLEAVDVPDEEEGDDEG